MPTNSKIFKVQASGYFLFLGLLLLSNLNKLILYYHNSNLVIYSKMVNLSYSSYQPAHDWISTYSNSAFTLLIRFSIVTGFPIKHPILNDGYCSLNAS